MVGIPLALVTMADTGKFISRGVTIWFEESMAVPTGLFLSLLCFYPVIGGLLFHHYADLQFRDAIYFSFTSIFTIGFGDLMPSINVTYLVVFIVFGVILVTITIDFVAAEVIDHIHYMGRHVGKAREIAGKMIQLAQSINMNRGITGLTAGMNQLQALARFGLLGRIDREVLEKGTPYAFAPFLEDMDFMDNASVYTPTKDEKPVRNQIPVRHLYYS
ncbi:Ion channel [Oesophagostomum dentatum]|uniref:Ion channel n=1 Tax=Oesophagostomum dentatum TaxID=61180 RepID=A0A0B1SKR9_OESDE|nr:Ion channel [Oesophagostomum dentatum]